MGESFAEAATSGPLLLAIGAAALAGLVSFLSPCILPLVPGYLSYVTGLTGVELDRSPGAGEPAGVSPTRSPRDAVAWTEERSERSDEGRRRLISPGAARAERAPITQTTAAPEGIGRATTASATPARRSRMLLGTVLFVLGFTATFTAMAVLSAGIGRFLFQHARALEIGGGVLILLLGIAFLGLVPATQRQWQIGRLPSAGLLGAPVFGAVFALSWLPCVGPTLGAVLTLAAVGGNTGRAATLAVAYGLGLGLPFVLFGVAFRRLLGVFRWVRRHSRWITRLGGALLILIGLALLTGGWNSFVIWLRGLFGTGEIGI